MTLDVMEVEAEADFDGIGLAAANVRYRARVQSQATAEQIAQLLRETDAVAEVHNTLRAGVEITLDTSSCTLRCRPRPRASGETEHLLKRATAPACVYTRRHVTLPTWSGCSNRHCRARVNSCLDARGADRKTRAFARIRSLHCSCPTSKTHFTADSARSAPVSHCQLAGAVAEPRRMLRRPSQRLLRPRR
jgi:hypothetical protein